MGIVWASSFWLAGIFFGRQLPLLPIHWGIFSLVAVIAIITLRQFRRQRYTFMLIFILTLAAARARLDVKELEPTDLGFYNDLDVPVTVIGTVVDDPDHQETSTALRVQAERLIIPSLDIAQPVAGDVLAHAHPYESWKYGDWVRLKGRLETPPLLDGFSYKEYLARKDIYSWMPQTTALKLGEGDGNLVLRLIYRLRGNLLDTIHRIFPEPEASLSAGILLGIESGIPADLYEDFNQTGATHIIAISGFNITLIASMFIGLARRLSGSRRGLWFAATGITLYTILVGADAAVVRAAIMGGLALIARYLGRDTFGLASLGATSVLMTAIDPATLWDVGFQLSFAATLGLVLYAQPLQQWVISKISAWASERRAKNFGRLIADFFLYTLAAQLTTWPLTMLYFQRFSMIAWIANPLILPLQPPLMILTGAATLLGTIWTPIGKVLALFAWPFPALTIRIVTFLAPFATGGLGMSGTSWWFVGSYYGALIGITLLTRTLRTSGAFLDTLESLWKGVRTRTAWLMAAGVLVIGFVWQSAVHAPDGHLHITFLDIGAGDAILIQSPTGQRILINGGKSPTKLMNHLGFELPLLQRKLPWLILGGTRTNQSAGLLGLVDHVSIDNVLLPPVRGSYSYQRLKEEVADSGITQYKARSGQMLAIGGGAVLEIIDRSESGMTMLIRYGDARILLPCGITPAALPGIVLNSRTKSVSVLLLPDGGHLSVNPLEWIEHTNPQVAVVSTSASDDRKRPAEDVLDALGVRPVLRTDLHGTIELNTDGRYIWFATEQ